MVLLHRPHHGAVGQVARDPSPTAAKVAALKEVGCVVALLVGVGRHEHDAGIVLGRLHVVHERTRRDAWQGCRLPPRRTAVLAHLHQAVVGADVEDPLRHRRLGDRRDRGVPRHGSVAVQGVHAMDTPGHLHLVPVEVAGKITADGPPRIASVVASPKPLRCIVDAPRRVRAGDHRRVPVPALRRVAHGRKRTDAHKLVASPVQPLKVALLRLDVRD